jgi:hypothetical protein
MILQVGDTVRIKSEEDIYIKYPEHMPYSLCGEMFSMLGKEYPILNIRMSERDDCEYCIFINGYSWPEGALYLKTPKGNSLD